MGGSGRWLEISGNGDGEALFEAVTNHVVAFLRKNVKRDLYRNLTPYLSECRYHIDGWGGCDTVLEWTFPDGGGGCSRSMHLWMHWLSIAIAAEWEPICALARAHGFEVTSPRWSIDTRGDDGIVELRDDLWIIQDDGLLGDGRGLGNEELTAEERELVEEARKVCACDPCRRIPPGPRYELTEEQKATSHQRAEAAVIAAMMAGHARLKRRDEPDAVEEKAPPEEPPPPPPAPEPTAVVSDAEVTETEAEMIAALRDPERAAHAATRVPRMKTASVELLLALINAAAWPSELASAVETYAPRVEGGWDAVVAALPTLDEKARTNAMHALVYLPRAREQTAWLLERIRVALESEDDDPACALARLAGRLRGVPAELPMQLARVLDREFIRDKMRASAVLGLTSLSSEIKPIPPEIKTRLQREDERGGEASGPARSLWFHWPS